MPVKLFAINEQFMIGVFLIKLTQGSLGKIFISPGNLIFFFYFCNNKLILFSAIFNFAAIKGSEQNIKKFKYQTAKNEN